MMIYTLTLNPAVDRELTVSAMEFDSVLRATEARVEAMLRADDVIADCFESCGKTRGFWGHAYLATPPRPHVIGTGRLLRRPDGLRWPSQLRLDAVEPEQHSKS